MYVRFPPSPMNVEDLPKERGVDVSNETARFRWYWFGPIFAAEIRKRRIEDVKSSRRCGHPDEVFVKINSEIHYLWRIVDQPMVPRHTALVWVSVAFTPSGIRTNSSA